MPNRRSICAAMSLPQATRSSGFPSILSKCIGHLARETGSLAPSRANPGFRFVMDVVRLKAPHLRSGRRDPPTFGMPPPGGAAMRHIARPDTLKRLSHSAIFCLHAAKEGISLPRFGGADQCRLAAGQFARTGGEKFCNSPRHDAVLPAKSDL